MTYALSWPLQEAVYDLLTTTPAVTALIGGRVYDAPPPVDGVVAPAGLYAVIGDEAVQDWSTKSDHGADHRITIALIAPRAGFSEAKQAAGAVSDAMLSGALSLSRGHVVGVWFLGAETDREEGDDLRRVEMTFRILIEDTA